MGARKVKAVSKLKVKFVNKRREATWGDNSVNSPVKEMNDTRKEVDKGSHFRGKLLHERLIKCGELKKKSSARDAKQYDKKRQDYEHKSSRTNFQEGAESALDEENTSLSSHPTPLATNVAPEGCLMYDVHPCLEQKLRAAMLKNRYADIIVKAQHTIFNHGKIPNPLKMQQEKRRFESIQCEEINKIKNQMQKSEDATAAKSQREKEKEATRVALRQMTNTANIYENIWVEREFNALIASNAYR